MQYNRGIRKRKGTNMEHIEMVERLHEKANITYTDAKDALERSGWDMLEALVLLEREGKIAPLTASTTSADDNTSYEKVTATASKKDSNFHEAMNGVREKLRKLFDDSLATDFVVRRQGKEVLRLQVLIALILCICLWEPVLVVLAIGLFCDCRYSFERRKEGSGGTEDHE